MMIAILPVSIIRLCLLPERNERWGRLWDEAPLLFPQNDDKQKPV